MLVVHANIMGDCPGGFCDYLLQFSELLIVLLLADGFIFLVTLIPPLFSWKNKKPDSKNRIFFAVFACLTFYFWLSILALNSLYCFGFLSYAGPCNSSASRQPVQVLDSQTTNLTISAPLCLSHNESSLKKITLVNCLIIVILIIVIAANINEVLHAKALYYQETLCRKEDIQKFLSSLVSKKPEVGHLVKCFHLSKSADAKTNSGHKVVTYSTVENFDYQTWKDFSDLRLIEPSHEYPVIEVEIVLNFFPGDQSTAEKYKLFVQKLTKTHNGKDNKISIDDYFHIEDQKEWTFFIGNKSHISPWWEKTPARILLSCIFLCGWPFRFSYKGKVAKHRIEVKKAVFVEANSQTQDEGVSLTATPGSSLDGCSSSVKGSEPEFPPALTSVSSPPPYSSPAVLQSCSPPYSSPAVELRQETPLLSRQETVRSQPGRDVVTAVTHHDINGLNAVSTVALKDVDVQMTSLTGYETYV